MELNAFSPQAFRFAVVGFSSNLVLYLVYLGLTSIGLGYKIAMSILYVVGVLQHPFLTRNGLSNIMGP